MRRRSIGLFTGILLLGLMWLIIHGRGGDPNSVKQSTPTDGTSIQDVPPERPPAQENLCEFSVMFCGPDDEPGRAVPGALVAAHATVHGTVDQARYFRTDATGRWSTRIATGSYTIMAVEVRPDGIRALRQELNVVKSGTHVLRFPKGSTLSCRVLDPLKIPLPGVNVAIQHAWRTDVVPERDRIVLTRTRGPSNRLHGVMDGEGRCEFRNIPEFVYLDPAMSMQLTHTRHHWGIETTLPVYRQGEGQTTYHASPEGAYQLSLIRHDNPVVEIRAVDETGAPVKEASVYVYARLDPSLPESLAYTGGRTDAEGTLRLSLQPKLGMDSTRCVGQPLFVEATHEGFAVAYVRGTIPPPGRPYVLVLKPASIARALWGTVQLADGRPACGFELILELPFHGAVARGKTNDHGEFELFGATRAPEWWPELSDAFRVIVKDPDREEVTILKPRWGSHWRGPIEQHVDLVVEP